VSALNSPFSNNSRASAAAVSELTQCLDLMFDQVNYKGDWSVRAHSASI
jgi:hypothetical protein